MGIVLEQVFILFIFLGIGYLFGKTGIVKHSHAKIISVLLTNLILPCRVFNAISSGFTVEYIKNYYVMLLISLGLVVLFLVLGSLASDLFTKNAYERKVYIYTLVTPNFGYMGYALAEGIFGASGLLNFIVFSLPMSFFVYTLGFSLLTNRRFSLKRILNPIIIALALGMVFGLTGWHLPGAIASVVDSSAACMSPLAMLVTGIAISEFSIGSLVRDYKAYIVSALRLIIIPLSVYFALKFWVKPDIVSTAVLFYAMPCGLNTIVFAKAVGEDYTVGAEFALISNIFSIITIPLIISIIH